MSAKPITWTVSAALIFLFAALPCAAAERYSASGVVLRVDRPRRSIEISCREIPGYMAAMVMNLSVNNSSELEGISPGAIIDFTIAVSQGSARAEGIHIHQFQSTDQEPMAARQLALLSNILDSDSRGTKPLAVGQRVPDFLFTSHNRERIALSQFAGKVVAITFLYTHCPLPNYCFRLSNNFGVVRKRFADRMARDLVLLSITFDPEHDQPEVLAQYACNWKAADAKGWYFLTGQPAEVQKVALEFGMNFWQDEGLFTHGLHTVVLDRRSKVVANLEGNEFTARQLGDLLLSVLSEMH